MRMTTRRQIRSKADKFAEKWLADNAMRIKNSSDAELEISHTHLVVNPLSMSPEDWYKLGFLDATRQACRHILLSNKDAEHACSIADSILATWRVQE